MFGAIFNLVTRVTAIIFGILKDDCLKDNSLPLNNCFSCRNLLQNDVNTLSKKCFKNSIFGQTAQFFKPFESYDLVQISPACFPNMYQNNVWRDFRLPVSTSETVAWINFNSKFTAKIDFPTEHFMLPILRQTLEV